MDPKQSPDGADDHSEENGGAEVSAAKPTAAAEAIGGEVAPQKAAGAPRDESAADAADPADPADAGDPADASRDEPAHEAAAAGVGLEREPAVAVKGAAPAALPIRGAAWGEPIAGLERRWTWLESRLLTFVLIWQLLALVSWVLLSGISSPSSSDDSSGTVFRSVVAAVGLGIAGWFGGRRLPLDRRRALTIAGIALGVLVGLVLRPPAGATSGARFVVNRALGLDRADQALVAYFGNIKAWLQDGSLLTMMGGLRGLATRLTLWLALLGASLATAAGKHIHIDVIFRFLPQRLRVPAAIVNFSAAAAVCFAGAWGFVDHIAIESFGANADHPASAKLARITHGMGDHVFLARKQIGLDLRSLPRVIAGTSYDRWMSAAAWNEWVRDAGFEDRYTPDQIKPLIVPEDAGPHAPTVISPDSETTRGMLVHDLNFVFPFGLLVIGLRFLLRAILTRSGHIPIDPDAAHKEAVLTAPPAVKPGPTT